MDDVPLCPPWWPDFLWWWLHHFPVPNPPDPWREITLEATEAILVALNGYATASALEPELRAEAQQFHARQIAAAAAKLQER